MSVSYSTLVKSYLGRWTSEIHPHFFYSRICKEALLRTLPSKSSVASQEEKKIEKKKKNTKKNEGKETVKHRTRKLYSQLELSCLRICYVGRRRRYKLCMYNSSSPTSRQTDRHLLRPISFSKKQGVDGKKSLLALLVIISVNNGTRMRSFGNNTSCGKRLIHNFRGSELIKYTRAGFGITFRKWRAF